MKKLDRTLKQLVFITFGLILLFATVFTSVHSDIRDVLAARLPEPPLPPTHWDERPAWADAEGTDVAEILEQRRNPAREARTAAAMPRVITPDPLIQQMIDQVNSTSVYSMTGELSGEWPTNIGGVPYTITNRNTYGGAPIQHAAQYVHEHFTTAGLNASYHQWGGVTYPNVVGEIAGLGRPDDILLITSHLDNMPTGAVAPGADDDGSGTIGVLTAAQILNQFNWDCSLRFIAFTGEEQGLLGSDAYAQMAANRGDNILGVLNLDMIAYNSDASPVIELHTRSGNQGDLAIANLFVDVVAAYGLNLTPQIEQSGICASDHCSFWQEGYSAILGIEDFEDFTPYYHTVNDRLQTLDMAYYTEYVRAAVGTFAHMGCLIGAAGALDGNVSDITTGAPLTATVSALGRTAPFTTTSDASGYYTLTLPADTYTVTAQAHLYGYHPGILSQVVVLTDTVTHLDLPLTPLPSFVLSGTVSDAASGNPLAASIHSVACPEGPCHPNTAVSVSSNPVSGHYSATLISGAYTLRVHSDGFRPLTRTLLVDHHQSQDFALFPQACVLLVDDDGGDDFQLLFQADLAALDVDFATWSVLVAGSPPLSLLEQYHHLLWFTGRRFSHTLTDADQATLSLFLDGGGDLLLSSWGAGFDLRNDPFLADYLFAQYLGDLSAGDLPLSGAGFMAGHTLTVTSAADHQVSRLNPLGSAAPIFHLPPPFNSPAALALDAHYGLVYLGFGLETASDDTLRQAALQAALDFLGPCPVLAPTPGFSSSSPDLIGSSTVFTLTTVGALPISHTWSFGDGSPPLVHPAHQLTLTHDYDQTGAFTVWLTATNPGGSASLSDTVHIVGSPPQAAFLHSAPASVGSAVVFTNTTTPGLPDLTAYVWDFGDGSPPIAPPPDQLTLTHAYSRVGSFTAWLTATNLAGSDGVSATVLITGTPPAAAFVHSSPALSGTAVVFTNTTTPGLPQETAFVWDFGDGSPPTTVPPGQQTNRLTIRHTYHHTGTFSVWLTATNSVGRNVFSDTLHVVPAPAAVYRIFLPFVIKAARAGSGVLSRPVALGR